MPFSLGFWAAAAAKVLGWSIYTAPAGTGRSIAYAGSISGPNWFYSQTSSATYYHSTSGASWTAGTMPSALNWRFFSSPTRVIGMATTTDGVGASAYSTNGTTWTAVNIGAPWPTAIADGLWNGNYFLVVGTGATRGFWYSVNGSSWNVVSGLSSFPISGIAWDGAGTYVFTRNEVTNNARICTSDPTVGANWTSTTLPASQTWTHVRYGNGMFVTMFGGSHPRIATSPDGVTWTARYGPSAYQGNHPTRLEFANGKFIMANRTNGFSGDFNYSTIWEASDPTLGSSGWTAAGYSSTVALAPTWWASSPTKTIGISGTNLLVKE